MPLELGWISQIAAEGVVHAAFEGARERVARHAPLFRAGDTMQPLSGRRVETPWRHLGHYPPSCWSAV